MEIIRQTGYLSSVPLQKKLATLEELYNQPGNPFSVHELCDALDVARGTFYNHIFRDVYKRQGYLRANEAARRKPNGQGR